MKTAKQIFIKIFLLLNSIVPKKYMLLMEDYFFIYIPIWIIRKLTISTDGYLKYFRPQKGDIVLDLGAFNGSFSIIASRLVGRRGKVFAFEPQREMFIYLNERINKYGLYNIFPIEKGAFSHKTSISVNSESPNAGFTILFRKEPSPGAGKKVTINLIDIDSFVFENKIQKLNFVKMDIEGAEIETLKGAVKSLQILSPKIAIASYHLRDGKKTAMWVESFLIKQGYNVWTNFPSHLTTYGEKYKTN